MDVWQRIMLKIAADNDQDRAEAETWWWQSSNADKVAVWEWIQREHDDPVVEIVSRLAQLAFGELAERMDEK
jgi:hypothetical protein